MSTTHGIRPSPTQRQVYSDHPFLHLAFFTLLSFLFLLYHRRSDQPPLLAPWPLKNGARSNNSIGLAWRHGETRTKKRTCDKRTAYFMERRLQSFLFFFLQALLWAVSTLGIAASTQHLDFSLFSSCSSTAALAASTSRVVASTHFLLFSFFQELRLLHKLLHKPLTVALSWLNELLV